MANYSKTKASKQKTRKQTAERINVSRCPENMSLENWQRQLRKYAASKEPFGIRTPQHTGDVFIVSSGKSGGKYRVEYFGQGSLMNRCECMDFKTNRLGTCKHIEAISLAENGRYASRYWPIPNRTYVYVDYIDGRKIKIQKKSHIPDEFDALINEYFDDSGVIRNPACDPSAFIRQAHKLDETFEWEPDALNLVIEARDMMRRRSIIKNTYADSKFDGLLKTKLLPYQADGVRFAFIGGRTINADEMGLGKTVQALATAELLKREGLVESVLIICPTSLKYQWLSEIKRFTNSTAIAIEGDVIKRRDLIDNPGPFYKICSFQAMANNIQAGFIPEVDMVIYDELQRLKNRDTKTGKLLRKLKSQYVLALSGTPLENRLEELYSVTQFVNQFLLGPLYKFNYETTLKDDLGKVTGYRNLHAVADKLSNIMIRRRKAEVKLQMPPRTDTNLFVPLTKEQRTIHDEYKSLVARLIFRWRRQKFLSEKDRKRLLLFLSMMRMVCDSTFILDQKSRYDTKIDELMAIITSLLTNDEGKVVIFSQWERMLRILARELDAEEIDYCFLHGGVPSPKRKDLIDRFREDPDCRIFLSTDAGATGLNLQSASLLINIDLPWNPAVLEQRIARVYRLGQKNPVQIINMIARDSIEERMLTTLNFKSNLAAGILDNGEDAVFIEGKKFDKIIEAVDDMINESRDTTSKTDSAETDTQPANIDEPTPDIEKTQDPKPTDLPATKPTPTTDKETPEATTQKATETTTHKTPETTAHKTPETTTHKTPETPDEMRELVAGGIAFLGKIADVLRKPQGVQTLADVLVHEDPKTGQASLNIPVPDKTTVVNLLTTITALLNK